MKRFVLNVLVFSAVFAAAEGIKCYICRGTEDDCAKGKLEADKAKYLKTCPTSPLTFDRCAKTWAKKNSTTEVVNACTTKAACDAAKKVCDYTTDGKCAISCCATDECNAGLTGLPTEGIKCYIRMCIGTENNCTKDKLEANTTTYLKTCPTSSDRCAKTWAKKDNTTIVVNGCSNKASCDVMKKTCDSITDGQCDVSCCETDECNAVSAGVPTDGGIKCYNCRSTEDDCAKDKLEADKAKYLKTCPSSYDRCMRTWAKKDNITSVANKCSRKATCDASKKACDNFDGPCDVNCCATDECNAVSAGEPTDDIKCYVCTGTEDDCAKDKLEANKPKYLMTCSSSYDRCMRTWFKKDGIDTVIKNSCASKTACDAKKKQCDDITDGATDGQCAVSCCHKDECNVGSSVSFSGFVMTVCSILGLALFNQA